ncbi:MAG TPA: selenoprotein O, partial [Devosia sp.]|nr:selenoprotein O [Devosia sp.]
AEDAELVTKIFAFLHDSQIGYEQFWFDWRGGMASVARAPASPAAAAYETDAFGPVRDALGAYETAPAANLHHPYFERPAPRTMLIDEMEALWAPIAERDDWSAFDAVLAEIESMRDAYAGDRKSAIRPGTSS